LAEHGGHFAHNHGVGTEGFDHQAEFGEFARARRGPFDLVFLDPPYRKGLIALALASLREGGWLAHGALLVAEIAEDEDIPPTDGFSRLDERIYNDTHVLFVGYSAA
jgi:16S rRNA (guanine966-N2)-methyltransferase